MERQELKEVCGALNFVTELIEGLSLGERAASGLYSIHGWERVEAARAAALAELERQEAICEFTTRAGRSYVMNGYGELCQKQYYRGPGSFSGGWLLDGGRRTWNAQRAAFSRAELIADPERLKGLWLIDLDHGTRRFWQGDGAVKVVRLLKRQEGPELNRLRASIFPQSGGAL